MKMFFECVVLVTGILLVISLAECSLLRSRDDLQQKNSSSPLSSNPYYPRRNVTKRDCHISLVFLLQGDSSVDEEEFQAQKNFVKSVVETIISFEESANFVVVQYNSVEPAIVFMYWEQFVIELKNLRPAGGHRIIISAALGYTGFQTRSFTGVASKFVFLGNLLGKIRFRASFVAKRLRDEGSQIGAIAVGTSTKGFWEPITGDSGFVLKVDTFFDLDSTVVSIVNKVCQLS